MDRRTEKTRQSIIDAFVKLTNKSGYEKVSVKDIIQEANIGRSTFYDHFKTKDELARYICYSLFDHIFGENIPICSTHDFSKTPPNTKNRITHILYHLRDKRQYYIGILTYLHGSMFLRFMREYMQQYIQISFTDVEEYHLNNIPEDFIRNHITNSLIGMIHWWLRGEMRKTPEEMADYFCTLMNTNFIELKHDKSINHVY